MNPSAVRGAILVAIAVIVAFLVLQGAADNAQFPVATGAAEPTPTPEPVDVEEQESVDVAETTVEIDTSLARPNSEVNVLVANGTEVSGQASRLTSTLRNQGFLTREPENADAQTTSTIFYRPGFAPEAAVVRNTLGGTTPIAPLAEPDPFLGEGIDLAPVDVLVLVGDDDLATQ